MPGVNSLEASPYRPPVITGMVARLAGGVRLGERASTSRNSGSPCEPGSLVRSSTATRRAVLGNAASSSSAGNGRNSRTVRTPTLSRRAVR